MQKTFIAVLLISVAVVIFALQNSSAVTVRIGIWNFDASLSLVILASLTLGALVSFLFSLITIHKKNKTIREKEHEIRALQNKRSEPEPPEEEISETELK